MHKFDEMFAQLPAEGPLHFQAQSMGGMSQVQVAGVTELVEGRIQAFRSGQEQHIADVVLG